MGTVYDILYAHCSIHAYKRKNSSEPELQFIGWRELFSNAFIGEERARSLGLFFRLYMTEPSVPSALRVRQVHSL